ncbi:MAG: 30S ribosomal protein S12 methylthiotransferase RimO [Caldilineales bacterium]|nr:30S ribosomal protein S12 methylthiotransferase RimO [Caldilineales bacterium]MDW8316404.1 30S ribosomal protein S12 methylthiotransferase RimO [Anaerolineae bacterium]
MSNRKPAIPSDQPTYYLLTLGCPKNTVDSEGMAMLLRREGYQATADPEAADVLIVNTCGFLEAAKEESIAALRTLAKGKRRRQRLIAAGCLAQRNGDEIVRRVPGVDALLGTRRWMEIVPLVERLRAGRPTERYALLGDPEETADGPVLRPPAVSGSAYLKISDGCNAPCAFCSIPSFKGRLRSRPLPAVVDEAEALVRGGARELVLVAQDTTDYGRDWGQPDSLPQLMAAICRRVPDLAWLRLMYAYPGHVSDRLIEVMAREPQIVHYLDMPLQHGHPDTLRRMRRPSSLTWVYRTVEKLRAAMPDIALRTTFIVGFPGETEEEFQGLLEFMQAVQFDRVGVFRFSPEPGTPAYDMPDQVPEEVKEERWHRVMALQRSISLARNQSQVGRTLSVLVEPAEAAAGLGDEARAELAVRAGRQRTPVTVGRSYRDAPEVDGLVVIPGVALSPGQMVTVRITGALAYDLVGELLPETSTAGEATSAFRPMAELTLV